MKRLLSRSNSERYGLDPMDLKAALGFLSELSQNNNRDWFLPNKPRYETIKQEFTVLVSGLIQAIAVRDPAIGSLQAEDCVLRIYRDVRFSKDKTPYYTQLRALLCLGGKTTQRPAYYLSIQSGGKSIVAGGLYEPVPGDLFHLRTAIADNPGALRKILKQPAFKRYFSGLSGEHASRPPRGFPKDHPDLDLLQFKSFTVTRTIPDEEVCGPKFPSEMKKMYVAMQPFCTYLRMIGDAHRPAKRRLV